MAEILLEIKCQDFDRPGCLKTPDLRYTMSFEDIGEGCIYFCSHCGPIAEKTNESLVEAFKSGGPAFAAKFEELVTAAENKKVRRS